MSRYRFTGTARKAGAIGITHGFEQEVTAPNLEAAHLALYEHWEHISVTARYALQSDGHWMLLNADGTRSIFDDVDQ